MEPMQTTAPIPELAWEIPVLSTRESDILRHLALGRTDKQIAAHLRISVKTVNHHVTRILLKLGADNRTHAVARALMSQLISLRATDAPVWGPERRQKAG